MLWYCVLDKRPQVVESPLDAVWWIVTVDYTFLAFDRFRRRALYQDIPVCLHPATLIPLLQFWAPRTQEFGEAVLSTLRLPLLFQDFDLAAEKVTIRILEALGRFDRVPDLPVATVTAMLTNDALRQKLVNEDRIESQIDLVNEALIDENKRRTEELRTAYATVETLRADREEASRRSSHLAEERDSLAADLERTRSDQASLAKQVAALDSKLESMETSHRVGRARAAFVARNVVLPVLAALALGLLLAAAWRAWAGDYLIQLSLLTWSTLGLGVIYWVGRSAGRVAEVHDWRPFVRFQRARRKLLATVALVVASAAGTLLCEVLRSPLGSLGKVLRSLAKHP